MRRFYLMVICCFGSGFFITVFRFTNFYSFSFKSSFINVAPNDNLANSTLESMSPSISFLASSGYCFLISGHVRGLGILLLWFDNVCAHIVNLLT